MLRKILAAACFALAFAAVPVKAQPVKVVATCGVVTPAFATATTSAIVTMDVNGNLCTAASVSASISGFTPGLTFASLTATGSSASVALPAGATVAFQNTGTTTVSCTLGVGSATATAGQVQVPASSTVFMTVGTNTFGACIDETGSASNVVRLAGGAGLGTGFGGGGGGGGGGTVVQGNAGSNAQAWWTQIGDTARGPAKVQAGNAAVIADVALTVADPNLLAAAQAATPAGTNSIGTIGFDPSKGAATPTLAFLALPATATTQIIALSGSTKTYVTFAKVFAGGTVNVTFKYGTGANCVTGTTTLEGPYPLTAQAGWTEGSGTGPVIIVPSGQALCITTDASVTGGVKLIYQQL